MHLDENVYFSMAKESTTFALSEKLQMIYNSYSTTVPPITKSTTLIKTPILHFDRDYAMTPYIITIKHENHYSIVE